MKRYITVNLEYESEESDKPRQYLNIVMTNLRILIQEDMPYLKVTYISDSPEKPK